MRMRRCSNSAGSWLVRVPASHPYVVELLFAAPDPPVIERCLRAAAFPNQTMLGRRVAEGSRLMVSSAQPVITSQPFSVTIKSSS